jgi:DNA-binding response OmpR family regulator
VGALLRRAYPEQKKRFLIFPPYEFDLELATVRINGEASPLTPKEFELATLFFRNIDRLMSRNHLQEAVWGRGAEVESRTVDTHVSNVRKKLGLRGEHGFRIAAIYHYGYRLKVVTDQIAKVFSSK